MALTSRKRSTFGQWLQFLLRFVGLNGLVAIAAGAFLWQGLGLGFAGAIVAGAGACAVALALLGEIRGMMEAAFSHRGAAGANVAVQVLLASALVVGANVFSFMHYKRFDCTEARTFTLDPAIREKLSQLRGDTDIIVYVPHVSFGQRVELRQDEYDQAAEKVIIDKVKDLAEQFGELGARFRVHVLDTQKKNTKERRKAINVLSGELSDDQIAANDNPTKEKPAKDSELLKTIEKAPENSIFFYSRQSKELQRLSFNDIYQLDKKASEEANYERGNLVLNYQGVNPFASKIFNIEEKKPRVALAIVHPLLGFHNEMRPEYTMTGAKKALNAQGFEATDLVLRKIDADGDLTDEPTALTYDESRFEQIDDELTETEDAIKKLEKEVAEIDELNKFWTESSLAKLNTKYVYFFLEDGRQGVTLRAQIESLKKSGIQHKLIDVDEDDREHRKNVYRQNLDVMRHLLKNNSEERDKLKEERKTLKAENLAEKRRLGDIETKTKSMLDNVDLLIVPRITILNAPLGHVIGNRAHRLDPAQLKALKTFIKEGKPVLFLLGPTNLPRESPDPGDANDQLEKMLGELGFKLPRQTILYNIEAKEYNERKLGGVFARKFQDLEVPGVKFDDTTLTVQFTKVHETLHPHAIRTSLKMMNRTTAAKKEHEVRIRHPRPVYFVRTYLAPDAAASIVGSLALPGLPGPLQGSVTWVKKVQQKPDEDSIFLVTREESWNEDKPFITKDEQGIRIPRFTPAKEDDPRKGTVEEPRLGPFPIGVAVETQVPNNWYDGDPKKIPKVRVAVIGSGGAFVGPSLPPLKEKMLTDVSNWLLGRDTLLARDSGTWKYPRVEIGPIQRTLWISCLCFALPLLFLYIGAGVSLVRRMR